MIDIWRWHQLIILALCLVAMITIVAKRTTWLVGLAYGYCALSALWGFQSPTQHWGRLQPYLDGTTAAALVTLLAIPTVTLIRLPYRTLFALTALLDTALLARYGYGLFNNAAMDSAYIVLASSYLGVRWSGIALLACILSRETTCIVMLAVWTPFMFRTWTPRILTALAVVGAGYLLGPARFLNPSGRIEIWRLMMDYWHDSHFHWFGTGIGSFQWIAVLVQRKTQGIFYVMHNDYLQLLFEGGVIGLALGLGVLAQCLSKRRHTATWLCLMVCMLTQFPLHWALSQLFVMWLAVETYGQNGTPPRFDRRGSI